MSWAMLFGATFGLGLFLLLRGLWPARLSLAEAVAPAARPARAASAGGWQGHIRHAAANGLGGLAVLPRSTPSRLAITGRTLEAHLAAKVVVATLAGLFAVVLPAGMGVAGVPLPVAGSGAAALLLAVAGFFVPDLALASQAAELRKAFRHAVGSYLDLVSISMAGGAGVESALHSSLGVRSGWAFGRLGDALTRARLTGDTPWEALRGLGAQFGVRELEELAASVALAGADGAKVRQSLAAKAASLRRHELAETEAEAASVTERMVLPVAVLLLGFLLFLGYPAIVRVLAGL